MKKNMVFYGGKKKDINLALADIVQKHKEIYDFCIKNCQRICMMSGTFNPDDMYNVLKSEFLAYMSIIQIYNPDIDISVLIDTLIKFD